MWMMAQGGILMWPLAALSVATLAVIFDRLIVFSTFRLYDTATEDRIVAAATTGRDAAATVVAARERAPALAPLLDDLMAPLPGPTKEQLAAVAIADVIGRLDRYVAFLGLSARVAPLLGLLGTVLGMIQTFSRLASTAGVVDMTPLADGIWQALLTTAAGLFIAVPAVVAHQGFQRWEERIEFRLRRLARIVATGAAARSTGP